MITKRTFKNIIILKMLTWFAIVPLVLLEEYLYPSTEQAAEFTSNHMIDVLVLLCVCELS